MFLKQIDRVFRTELVAKRCSNNDITKLCENSCVLTVRVCFVTISVFGNEFSLKTRPPTPYGLTIGRKDRDRFIVRKKLFGLDSPRDPRF